MGLPPGMGPSMGPPMGGPMDASMGGPMGPPSGQPPGPPPPEEPLPPPTYKDIVLKQIRQLRELRSPDEIRGMVMTMPEQLLAQLRDWQMSDPYAALLLDDIVPPEQAKPTYPKWLMEKGPPPKPTEAQIHEMVLQDFDDWAQVREEIHMQLVIYHMTHAGAFDDFDEKRDELFFDESLVGEVNSIIFRMADTPVKWRYEAQSSALREDGQKSEDFIEYQFKQTNRRYIRAGNHDLRRDVAFYLAVCGYAAARTGMRFNDGRYVFDYMMADPGTTVPLYDDNGLVRVTRRYQDTVANVIAAYDWDGSVRQKLLSEPVTGTIDKFRRMDEYVLVETYDDRWWRAVYVDGKEIIAPVAHEYGFCPWIYQGAFLGEPMQIAGAMRDETLIPAAGMRSGEYRLKYKHQSYFTPMIKGHRQKEAILSKLYSLWKKADKPTWLWFYDDFAKGKGVPEVPVHGQITPLNMNHEDLKPMLEQVNPAIFGTLFQASTAIEQRTKRPLATFGEMAGTQQSGQQMEGSAESGYEKESYLTNAAESFYTQLGELWLMMWRDWGWMYWKDGEPDFGSMEIPYQGRRARRGANPTFIMVPEVVRRVGTDGIEAVVKGIRTSGLAALGNAVAIWVDKGLMSDATAMEFRGVTDVDEELEEIEYDHIRKDPAISSLRKYKVLREQDPELAELYRENVLSKQSPAGPQPPMGMGSPMGQAGPVPQPSPTDGLIDPTTSAMNLTALGMGAQGPTGRPPGSVAPVDPMALNAGVPGAL